MPETPATLLDGGLATHLQDLGHDISGELWSARLLLDNPGAIRQAHRDYFRAGADAAITATYQASLPALQHHGLTRTRATRLLRMAVDLAIEAKHDTAKADTADTTTANTDGRIIAASIGPYGAALANGAEYTGDYDLDTDGLTQWHRERWHILAATPADVLACETIPSHAETRALARLIAETPHLPAWITFSCRDAAHISDGTPITEAAAALRGLPNLAAIGANCTAPQHIPGIIQRLHAAAPDTPIAVYPNSGETWDPARRQWTGTADPADFAAAAGEWRRAGASLIGGCCRTTPEHIRRIRTALG